MVRRARCLLGLGLAGILAAGGAAAAVPATAGAPSATAGADAKRSVQESIATTVVAGTGPNLEVEESLRKLDPLGHQVAFEGMLDRLRLSDPDLLVNGEIVDREAGKYVLRLTATPPDSLLAELRGLPFDTVVQSGFPVSESGLRQAVQDVAGRLSAINGVSEVAVYPARDGSGLVVAEYAATKNLAPEGVSAAVLGAPDSPYNLVGNDVRISFKRMPADSLAFSPQVDVRGGHGAASSCTTGFTANYGGRAGVLTAGHCSGGALYDGMSGIVEPAVGMNYPSIGGGNYIDVRHNATASPHTTSKLFRESSSAYLTVSGIGTPALGGSLCKYGRATGRNCGDLYAFNVDVCRTSSLDGRTVCRLVETNRLVTEIGDSGGPWFWGSSARGTTVGGSTTRSYFMLASAMNDYGITIRQN